MEELCARLEGVQGKGPHRRAICPAHQSKHKTRSLSVLEKEDGRILMKCHASCGIDSVLAALGIEFDELYPPRLPDGVHSRPMERKSPWGVRTVAQALEVELIDAYFLLAKMGGGGAISARDRTEALRLSEVLPALLKEIGV